VAATVDWTAYTQTISRFRNQRIQITKLCNDLLPTARWVNRYESLTTEHCIHCGKIEDRDHIIQCSHEPHNSWRKSLLSKLRKVHDSDMSDHYLCNILVNGLHCGLTDPSYAPFDTQNDTISLFWNNQPWAGVTFSTGTSLANGDYVKTITSAVVKSPPTLTLALVGPYGRYQFCGQNFLSFGSNAMR
jgi:hypothetical protein